MWNFIKSASSRDSWLQTDREVCFVGRSNVGKSSLINAIANNQKIAITSKTPGRTMLINYFQDGRMTLVDLPGYGYAKASLSQIKTVSAMVFDYLKNREQLVNVFVLIDAFVGPTNDDMEMLNFLMNNEKNFTVIITKSDKTNQSETHRTKKKIEEFTLDYLFVSAKSRKNIDQLQNRIKKYFE